MGGINTKKFEAELEILKQNPVLSKFPEEFFKVFIMYSQIKIFSEREILVEAGDVPKGFFYITKGKFSIWKIVEKGIKKFEKIQVEKEDIDYKKSLSTFEEIGKDYEEHPLLQNYQNFHLKLKVKKN